MSKKQKSSRQVIKQDVKDDYFRPPHGGRPPSDEAIHEATQRYIREEKEEMKK